MQKVFDKTIDFQILFVGTKFNFEAIEFHKACDNKGATLTIFKTDVGDVFGYYTSQPWKSSGGFQHVWGRSFFFKLIGKDVVLFESKPDEDGNSMARNYHVNDCLVAVANDNFCVYDKNF